MSTKKKSAKGTSAIRNRTSGKPSQSPKSVRNKINNRIARAKRYKVPNLWVTEFQGDFQFLLPVDNISEGGIFIRGRARGDALPSRLVLRLGKHTLKLEAQGVHDAIVKNQLGTGYCFVGATDDQTSVLKSFLRNLN